MAVVSANLGMTSTMTVGRPIRVHGGAGKKLFVLGTECVTQSREHVFARMGILGKHANVDTTAMGRGVRHTAIVTQSQVNVSAIEDILDLIAKRKSSALEQKLRRVSVQHVIRTVNV